MQKPPSIFQSFQRVDLAIGDDKASIYLAIVPERERQRQALPDGPWQDVLNEEELRVPPGRFFWLAEPGESAPALVGAFIPPSTILPPERRYEDQDSARVLLEVSITDESQLSSNAAREYWAACEAIEEGKSPCLVLVPFTLDSPLSAPPLPFGSLQQHASAMGHALLAEMLFEALDHWCHRVSQ